MKNTLKITFALAIIITMTLSSCKRGGYGCPNELKLPKLSLVK